MKAKKILSYLFGIGLVFGFGSCNNDMIPRESSRMSDNTSKTSVSSVRSIDENRIMTISSWYEDRNSQYYGALIPEDCQLEVLKFCHSPANHPLYTRLEEVHKYDTLKKENVGGYGLKYYANIQDHTSDVYIVGHPDDNFRDESSWAFLPPPTYHAAIVCPKGKYKVIGVTVDGSPVNLSKVENLGLRMGVERGWYHPRIGELEYTKYDKDIFYLTIDNTKKVSFLLGGNSTGEYIGASCCLQAKIHDAVPGTIKFIVENIGKNIISTQPNSGLETHGQWYLPKGCKVKISAIGSQGVSELESLYINELGTGTDLLSGFNTTDSTFFLERNTMVNAHFINAIQYTEIKVGDHTNVNLRFTVGDKVYVNEGFVVERGTPVIVEAIVTNPDDYRFNCFNINNIDIKGKEKPNYLYLSTAENSEYIITTKVDPLPSLKYQVDIQPSTNGVVQLSESGLVDKDSEVEVYATANAGYKVVGIYVNGKLIDGSSFKVKANSRVKVVFNKI